MCATDVSNPAHLAANVDKWQGLGYTIIATSSDLTVWLTLLDGGD